MRNLVAELQWRGLVHDMMPGTEEQLLKEMTTTYIGFDPTSDSLHIGSLVPIILLVHLERFGHKPIALVGGATGMIGDPSGKSDERNLLDEATLEKNVAGIKAVLSRFLDFNSTAANAPILVNNYDWMKDFSFINFARDVGKRITVNYMMAKDSVKKRLSGESGEGMSFTEFTYQLIQGYDFHHLYKTHNCLLQMGGSDQWGNITTGTELVRRMNGEGAKAYAMTCPLITKADGSKFGKSEGGNVWLTADKTSVYKFYQFWLNTTDVDAEKYIKIFTFLDKDTIDALIAEHQTAPHLRVLQKRLAEEVSVFVHGREELEKAIFASGAFFSPTMDDLKKLDTKTFLEVFEGVPQAEVEKADIENGLDMIAALSAKTGFLASNSEARRELQQNAISLNKEKVTADYVITEKDLINGQFLMLQKGKKNYFLIMLKNVEESLPKKLSRKSPGRVSASVRTVRARRVISARINSLRVSGFKNERKYIDDLKREEFIFMPRESKSINLSGSYKVVSKVEGVKHEIDSCIIKYSGNSDSLSIPKKLRSELALRKEDKVSCRIDRKNSTIIIELKSK